MTSRSVAPVPPLATVPSGTPPLAVRPAVLGAYFGAFVLAEWLVTLSVPAAAGCFAVLALATCLGLCLPLDRSAAVLLPVLAALPVVRLCMLAMPTADLTPLTRGAVLAVPTLVAVAAVAGARDRRWGLLRAGDGGWWAQARVAMVGVPLAPFVYWLAPATPGWGEGVPIAAAGVLLAFAVIPDELLFRGLLVPALAGVVRGRAVFVAAIVYAATFLAFGSMATVLAAFGVAWTLGWLRQRTGSVVGVVGARVVIVLLVGLVLPAAGAS